VPRFHYYLYRRSRGEMEVIMKKVIFILIAFCFCLVFSPAQVVLGDNSIDNNPCYLSTDSPDPSVDNIPLSEEELKKIHEKMEKLNQEAGPGEPTRSTSVPIGTSYICSLHAGQVYLSDNSPHTIGDYGTDSSGWLDCRTEYSSPFATGDGYAWGWFGEYICVTGSGSQGCTITFRGDYDGELQATGDPIGTNCYVWIGVQVYDVTGGGFTKIAEKVIEDVGYVFTVLPTDVSGDIDSSDSVHCTLQAGHNYLLRVRLYTSASADWLEEDFWGRSDFSSNPPAANGEGIDTDYVFLDWD